MLWSKNLISQNDSVQTYNNFVRQINAMQKEEQNILNKRLENYTSITDEIDKSLAELTEARIQLQRRMTLLDKLIYWARRPS